MTDDEICRWRSKVFYSVIQQVEGEANRAFNYYREQEGYRDQLAWAAGQVTMELQIIFNGGLRLIGRTAQR